MQCQVLAPLEAARYACKVSEWNLSNLQLQKILYIAQMYYLGKNNGEPLISGFFQAWDYGPVIPEVYDEVKIFGKNPIQDIFIKTNKIKDDNRKIFLKQAVEQLSSVNPMKLVSITHWKDGAWAKIYRPNKKGLIIENDLIIKEYKLRQESKK